MAMPTPDLKVELLEYISTAQDTLGQGHATFRVKAPVFLARHLAELGVGLSMTEVPPLEHPDAFLPEAWLGQDDEVVTMVKDRFGRDVRVEQFVNEAYDYAENAYLLLLDAGVVPELAQMVLPLGVMTEWLWSGPLTAWIALSTRTMECAVSREVRQLAGQIASKLENA